MYPNEYSNINRVIELADVTNESGFSAEPVTVAEFKNYARLEGFQDGGESGEVDFNSDDLLIQDVIIAAREAVENYTGRSLVRHIWKARIDNEAGDLELPMSNGAEVTSILDCDGNEIEEEDYTINGIEFKQVNCPRTTGLTVTYDTNGNCPKRLKLAVLVEALFRYENRGDLVEQGALSEKALGIANSFKKVSTWLA